MDINPTYEVLSQRVQQLERENTAYQQDVEHLQTRIERLELAITGTDVGLWDWNLQNDHVHFSRRWKQMLGYEDHEIENVYASWQHLWHPDDAEKIERAIADHLSGKTSLYELEHRLRHKDGSWRWILARGDFVRDASGRAVRWVGTHLDITERKEAEEALRTSQEFLTRVINENPFPIWIGDQHGTIMQCNKALLDLLQLRADQLVGKYNILQDPLIQEHHADIRNIFDKGISWSFEVKWQSHPSIGVTSKLIEIAGVVFPIFGQDGNIVNIVATYHDITARKRAQNELQTSLMQLKQLTEHLHSVREQERTIIARDLHDELGQVLTAINLSIGSMTRKLLPEQVHLKEKARETAKLAVRAIESTKRIIYELRPALLEDLGFSDAVRHQVNEYQKHCKIKFSVSIAPDDITLDNERAIAVLRILQEALTNAVRHSKASRVIVRVLKTDTDIMLDVEDDGIGIKSAHHSSKASFGIVGIRERVAFLNGTLELSGSNGHGTTVTVSIPLKSTN